MSSPDDMVGASAVDSYAAVEAYETGRRFGRDAYEHGWDYDDYPIPDDGLWSVGEHLAWQRGYETGWANASREASVSVDSRTVEPPQVNH